MNIDATMHLEVHRARAHERRQQAAHARLVAAARQHRAMKRRPSTGRGWRLLTRAGRSWAVAGDRLGR